MSLEVFEDKLFSGGDDSIVRIWNTNNWSALVLRFIVATHDFNGSNGFDLSEQDV